MCGISGIYSISSILSDDKIKNYNNIFVNNLNHRGPDSNNYYVSNNKKLLLTHNRLSIIDISDNASQPMFSENKNFVLSYNGEIYNHIDLKNNYLNKSKTNWLTHSDSKTLVELFSEKGFGKTLTKINGMFAISLYNVSENKLYLARDRFGEKPIYYGLIDKFFVFSSELSSIKKLPFFNEKPNKKILTDFLYSNNVPHPFSAYENIFKLSPGSYIELDLNDIQINQDIVQKKFWNVEEFIKTKKNENINQNQNLNINYYSDKLENLLNLKIKDELISDVEIGAFLSGGVDSTLISLIAQNQYKKINKGKLNTFSLGYDDPNFDESSKAKKIANILDTNHHEMIINSNDAMDVIGLLPKIYSEPFGDSSQIPTYILSKFVKNNINVALTGDGGDEIFGGYNRYIFSIKYWPLLKKLPLYFRKFIKLISNVFPEDIVVYLIYLLNNNVNKADLKNKINKFLSFIDANSDESLYAKFIGFDDFKSENDLYLNDIYFNKFNFIKNTAEKFMLNDIIYYLPNDILCKVDRAAMNVSLETRCPFLDHEIFEFSQEIPFEFKINNKNNSKFILKNILSKYLPRELFINNKMGFAIPLSDWLKGPLREMAESLLKNSKLSDYTLIDDNYVKTKWQEFINGKNINQNLIWNFLMLELWISNDSFV